MKSIFTAGFLAEMSFMTLVIHFGGGEMFFFFLSCCGAGSGLVTCERVG